MHNACLFGDYDLAEMLINYGARYDIKNNQDYDALKEAEYRGSYHILELLTLKKFGGGISINIIKKKLDLIYKQNGITIFKK